MPAPRNKTSSTSQPSRHWLLTVLTVMTAAAVSLTADMETFQRNQLVLGHFMEFQGEVFDAKLVIISLFEKIVQMIISAKKNYYLARRFFS